MLRVQCWEQPLHCTLILVLSLSLVVLSLSLVVALTCLSCSCSCVWAAARQLRPSAPRPADLPAPRPRNRGGTPPGYLASTSPLFTLPGLHHSPGRRDSQPPSYESSLRTLSITDLEAAPGKPGAGAAHWLAV
jgi:hypothetical protein